MFFHHWRIRRSARTFWYIVPRLATFFIFLALLWTALLIGPHT